MGFLHIKKSDIKEAYISSSLLDQLSQLELTNTKKLSLRLTDNFTASSIKDLVGILRHYFKWKQGLEEYARSVNLYLKISMNRLDYPIYFDAIKQLWSLPISSVRVLFQSYGNEINRQKIEECLIEPIRKNKNLRCFKYDKTGYPWIRNLDLNLPDKEDKMLIDQYLESILDWDKKKLENIQQIVENNVKHRLDIF
jgi:hypothetical protein